jgi:glycosyltransferase involved in cell wall biosynthesis
MISLVITSYRRPEYLKRAILSAHEYADCPFELIVHDDGSSPETREVLAELADKVTAAIHSSNPNVGLNKAINRCVSVASSPYILFMCDDCWLTEPCFLDVKNVLSRPYVGWVCPGDNRLINTAEDLYTLTLEDNQRCVVEGTSFGLTNNLLGAYTLGFRKDVWQAVGGWDENISSARSDNVFIAKLIKAGYWKAVLEGNCRIQLANNDPDYIPTAPLATDHSTLGNFFGMSKNNEIQLRTLRVVKNNIWEAMCLQEGGLANIHHWFDYFFRVFGTQFVSIFDMQNISYDPSKIDWYVATEYNQDTWKELLLEDFGCA